MNKIRILEKFKDIIRNKKLNHLYLFESNKSETDKLSFVFDLSYEFLKDDYNSPNLKYLIQNFSYPNFYYLSSNQSLFIKKEQILEMKQYFNQTSLIQSKKVYVINKIEDLSYEAANSLLHFLENPINNDILGILLTNNHNLVLSTIVSRAQFFYLDFLCLENKKLKTNFGLLSNKKKIKDILILLLNKFRIIEKNNEIKNRNYYVYFEKFFLKFINNFNQNISFTNLFLDAYQLLQENNFIHDFLFILTIFFLDLYYNKLKLSTIFYLDIINNFSLSKISLKEIIVFLNIFIKIEKKSYFLDNSICFLNLLIKIDEQQKKIF